MTVDRLNHLQRCESGVFYSDYGSFEYFDDPVGPGVRFIEAVVRVRAYILTIDPQV